MRSSTWVLQFLECDFLHDNTGSGGGVCLHGVYRLLTWDLLLGCQCHWDSICGGLEWCCSFFTVIAASLNDAPQTCRLTVSLQASWIYRHSQREAARVSVSSASYSLNERTSLTCEYCWSLFSFLSSQRPIEGTRTSPEHHQNIIRTCASHNSYSSLCAAVKWLTVY